MNVGPLAYTGLLAGGIGGGSLAAMAATDGEAPRKILMGTVVGGLTAAAVSGVVGSAAGASMSTYKPGAEGMSALAKWGHSAGITGMSKGAQAGLATFAIGIGVATALIGAHIVLDINERSLAGN